MPLCIFFAPPGLYCVLLVRYVERMASSLSLGISNILMTEEEEGERAPSFKSQLTAGGQPKGGLCVDFGACPESPHSVYDFCEVFVFSCFLLQGSSISLFQHGRRRLEPVLYTLVVRSTVGLAPRP